jgi:hypothetical protein
LSSALSFFNQETNMPASSPCGIGGPSNPGGPCTGVLNPSDAGSGAFAGLSVSPAIAGVIAAGAILAFLIFTVWAVRKVGTFFDSNRRANLSLGMISSGMIAARKIADEEKMPTSATSATPRTTPKTTPKTTRQH